jgi:glutamine amidotransferase-like uncharacterized protein
MSRPVALVYRGPASVEGCPEAIADLLAESPWRFDVRYTGPREDLPLTAATLAGATVYAQPGGGTLKRAFKHLKKNRKDIRRFVRDGGRYLGFCLGGYLAGATPGFGLLPGDTDQYVGSQGAEYDDKDSTVIRVRWRGRTRTLFFQDGPYFWVEDGARADVLATYRTGRIAALVAGFGAGRVGVTGPHPEATEDWFTDAGLAVPEPGLAEAHDLIDSVMAGERS